MLDIFYNLLVLEKLKNSVLREWFVKGKPINPFSSTAI